MRCVLVQLAHDPAQSMDERIAHALNLVAAQRGADLVVLPELWPTGGFTYDAWEPSAQPLDGPLVKAFAEAARDVDAVVHMGSFVERLPEPGPTGQQLANTSVLFDADGKMLATYRKMHLFGFSAGEPRLMSAGADVVAAETAIGRFGLATCYDLRFPELFRRLGDDGVQTFVVPAAWPSARIEHWRVLARARAIENQCAVLAVNMVGLDGGTLLGGCSVAIDVRGDVLAEASRDAEEVLTVDLDPAAVARWRADFPVLADRRL